MLIGSRLLGHIVHVSIIEYEYRSINNGSTSCINEPVINKEPIICDNTRSVSCGHIGHLGLDAVNLPISIRW